MTLDPLCWGWESVKCVSFFSFFLFLLVQVHMQHDSRTFYKSCSVQSHFNSRILGLDLFIYFSSKLCCDNKVLRSHSFPRDLHKAGKSEILWHVTGFALRSVLRNQEETWLYGILCKHRTSVHSPLPMWREQPNASHSQPRSNQALMCLSNGHLIKLLVAT